MIHTDFFDVVKNKILEKLTTFHKDQPLKAGIPRQELRSTVPGGDKLFKTVIENLVAKGEVVDQGDTIAIPLMRSG